MNDLISRQDAIDAIARDIPFITFTEEPKRTAQRIIGTVSSADAVEVVRCKECRHSRIEGDDTLFMWCGYWNKPTDGNRYCSDGERREP